MKYTMTREELEESGGRFFDEIQIDREYYNSLKNKANHCCNGFATEEHQALYSLIKANEYIMFLNIFGNSFYNKFPSMKSYVEEENKEEEK